MHLARCANPMRSKLSEGVGVVASCGKIAHHRSAQEELLPCWALPKRIEQPFRSTVVAVHGEGAVPGGFVTGCGFQKDGGACGVEHRA